MKHCWTLMTYWRQGGQQNKKLKTLTNFTPTPKSRLPSNQFRAQTYSSTTKEIDLKRKVNKKQNKETGRQSNYNRGRNSPHTNRGPPRHNRCYNCDRLGHFARQRPQQWTAATATPQRPTVPPRPTHPQFYPQQPQTHPFPYRPNVDLNINGPLACRVHYCMTFHVLLPSLNFTSLAFYASFSRDMLCLVRGATKDFILWKVWGVKKKWDLANSFWREGETYEVNAEYYNVSKYDHAAGLICGDIALS